MASFDVSKEWLILLPPDVPGAKEAAEDLSRCIGLLAGLGKFPGGAKKAVPPRDRAPRIADAYGPSPEGPIITLANEGGGFERNGFSWRAAPERVEILGESGRGLCNGIYSFLAALGISWPAPGEESLPAGASADTFPVFPLADSRVYEASRFEGNNPAGARRGRFVPSGKKTLKLMLEKAETFVSWAARRRYDVIIVPLGVFASGSARRKLKLLKRMAESRGMTLEAGGRDLSSLVPRKYFFFHRDFFRMEEGKRKKAHHFCPTNPGTIGIIGKEGGRLFRLAEGVSVFHLWPDREAETTWCSCPTCRAFNPSEQNRIAVNAAADILANLNPAAAITFFEKSGGGNIPLRKNIFRMERLPDEKESIPPEP